MFQTLILQLETVSNCKGLPQPIPNDLVSLLCNPSFPFEYQWKHPNWAWEALWKACAIWVPPLPTFSYFVVWPPLLFHNCWFVPLHVGLPFLDAPTPPLCTTIFLRSQSNLAIITHICTSSSSSFPRKDSKMVVKLSAVLGNFWSFLL